MNPEYAEAIYAIASAESALRDALQKVTVLASKEGNRDVWEVRKLLAKGNTTKAIERLIEMVK